jgi:hypothetical protein
MLACKTCPACQDITLASGSGRKDETSPYNRFNVATLNINADGIQAQLGERDSLAALAQQPGMAWVNQATISLVNNNGDLGAVFKELGSSESIKNIATAMVTAGALQGLSSGILPDNLVTATNGAAPFTDQLQRELIDGVASSLVRSAINGTSLEDELQSGLATATLNTVAAQGVFEIGTAGPNDNQRLNAFTAEVAHAILGYAAGAGRASAGGGSAATGLFERRSRRGSGQPGRRVLRPEPPDGQRQRVRVQSDNGWDCWVTGGR